MDKLYERVNWENEPSTKTPKSAENFNVMDEGIDSLEDRVIEEINRIDGAIGNIQGGGAAGSSELVATSLSGGTDLESLVNQEFSFDFNWSSFNTGEGTVILDLDGQEKSRAKVQQGDVSVPLQDFLPEVKTYYGKVIIVDSAGNMKCFPLSFKMKSNDTWAGAPDNRVVELLQKHYAGEINIYDYWNVGEIREVDLAQVAPIKCTQEANNNYNPLPDYGSQPAQKIQLVLANKGYSAISAGTIPAFVVCQRNPLQNAMATNFTLSQTSYNNLLSSGVAVQNKISRSYYGVAYERSLDRYWLNNNYYNALPDYLKPLIKNMRYKTYDATDGGVSQYGRIITLEDKIAFIESGNVFAEATGSYTISGYGRTEWDGVLWEFFANEKASGNLTSANPPFFNDVTVYGDSRILTRNACSSSYGWCLKIAVVDQQNNKAMVLGNVLEEYGGVIPYFCI